MTNTISYPTAKDENGHWVNIDSAHHRGKYYCPECDSPFIVRLGTVRRHHFAHKPGSTVVCTGESGFHHLAKHMLAYHFEQKKLISLLSKCPDCARVLGETKKIIKVEVEKGQSDYRPDVRLILEDDLVIDCEVVFRNPLGDKLTAYREKGANLLVWEIEGQVNEVPHQIQYSWELPAAVNDKFVQIEITYLGATFDTVIHKVLFRRGLRPVHAEVCTTVPI